MRAKRIWLVHEIFIKAIVIMMPLWLSWTLRAKRCQMMRAYIN
jgi:hypothetical protein